MATHGYKGGYVRRWRTLREYVDEAIDLDQPRDFILYMIGLYRNGEWVAYDVTGDESRKRVTARLNADRAAEGLPAITEPQELTEKQLAALGLADEDDEIPFDGTVAVIEEEPNGADECALIVGMAGAR